VHILRNTFGIDASGHQPRDVRGLDLNEFDLIIAIENNAAVVVRELGAPESKLQVWSIQDPWGGDLTEYERVALDIRKRLARLKQTVSHEAGAVSEHNPEPNSRFLHSAPRACARARFRRGHFYRVNAGDISNEL
jgi:hypothetical protein